MILSVHNEGVPIPPDKMANLFDSLTRAVSDDDNPGSENLGLGLYIPGTDGFDLRMTNLLTYWRLDKTEFRQFY